MLLAATDRHTITDRLHRFHETVLVADLPEATRLAQSIEAWWPEILGFLDTRHTNAATEGTILWSPSEGVLDVPDGGVTARQRHVLCLSSSTSPMLPRLGSKAQMSLEWLSYKVSFRHYGHTAPVTFAMSRYVGR